MYSPEEVIVPGWSAGIDQVTPVLPLPVTVAVNCCTWLAYKVAVVGAIVTTIGTRLTIAEADLAGSASLVAVTVIVCAFATMAGAEYVPDAETEPIFGLID